MSLFPVFANLQNRRVLVVGGGEVAERKVKSLLHAGAQVVVGSPTLTEALQQLAHQGRITVFHGRFEAHWLSDAWLVVAATASHSVNQHVARAATVERIFINVVDDPDLSTFQVPSIVDRSPLTIAISSSGNAPVLARRLRERIESLFDHSLGPLAALAGKHRQAIRRHRPHPRQRREFYDWLLDGPVALALRQQQSGQAERLLTRTLQQPACAPLGRVVLVGAGPGDPGLLTLKALRALNEADVILHDRLISPEILALARRDALQISVGKTPGANHDATQERIHRLMHKHAQAGQCVVRLKGGDALVFGRGGEELEFLRAQGIPYEVVPGITAALACAAYAGVPLTHRDHAQSARLTTAHSGQNKEAIDWVSLAQERQTLAFYMGVSQLEQLSAQLIAHGRSGATPFALVENGSRADQRVLTGSLRNLPALAHRHQFQAPSLLLVGQVAALAPTLHWFGSLIKGDDPVQNVPEPVESAVAVAACA